ncbi:MAG: hypothetical protein ACI9JN_002192, partial [Bacteroidia bacterium]
DLVNLSRNRVVEVQCDDNTGETKDKPKDQADKNVPLVDKTKQTDDDNKGGDTKKADDQTQEGDPQIADKGPKGNYTEPKTDKPSDKVVHQPTTSPTISSVTDPLVKYKSDQDIPAYYVIAISTKDKALAERSAKLIAQDYQIVKVIPQSNGFYRVGIYATKSKSEALKILDYAKTHGIPSGWIAFE